MKLRQIAEDFIVEEINQFKLRDEGDYKMYSLEKRNIETFFLISHLSKKNNIPSQEFGIAGLKDKHAVTKQYFTIPKRFEIKTLREQNFKIEFLGYVEKGLETGDLIGNRFEITVRAIRKGELEGIKQKSRDIEEIGVPNYFDSQRFGSVQRKEFIARYLMKKDYKSAVKIYLTNYTKFEPKMIKDEKRLIAENFDHLETLNLKTRALAVIVEEYKKNKSFQEAYRKIPENLRQMFISAYQSYIWNECIKEVLRRTVDSKSLYTIEYNIGNLIYYKKLKGEEFSSIPKTFQSVSEEIEPTEFEKDIINKVLAKQGVTIPEFSIKKETGNYFKTHKRWILLKPKDFVLSDFEVDDINDQGKKNFFKVTLSFTLPKGSYATVVTKRVFNT